LCNIVIDKEWISAAQQQEEPPLDPQWLAMSWWASVLFASFALLISHSLPTDVIHGLHSAGQKPLAANTLMPRKSEAHVVLPLKRQNMKQASGKKFKATNPAQIHKGGSHLLHAAEHKGTQDAVKSADQLGIHACLTFDHAGQGVAEPALELCVAREDVWHEKMHEAPELHEVILEGCAGDEEAVASGEVEEGLPAQGTPVLYHVGLVQDEVLPSASLKHLDILQRMVAPLTSS
jgi:hypothetical protein